MGYQMGIVFTDSSTYVCKENAKWELYLLIARRVQGECSRLCYAPARRREGALLPLLIEAVRLHPVESASRQLHVVPSAAVEGGRGREGVGYVVRERGRRGE